MFMKNISNNLQGNFGVKSVNFSNMNSAAQIRQEKPSMLRKNQIIVNNHLLKE